MTKLFPGSESSKFTVALLLFMLALLLWGLKTTALIPQKKLAEIFATGIKSVIEFGAKTFPYQEQFSLQLSTLGNNDTITVNRKTHEVTSLKNFTYHYKGYTIVCSVSYEGNNFYSITCKVK